MIAKVANVYGPSRDLMLWRHQGRISFYYRDVPNGTPPDHTSIHPFLDFQDWDHTQINRGSTPLMYNPIKSLKVIEYENSNFRRFTDCTHLQLRVHGGTSDCVGIAFNQNGLKNLSLHEDFDSITTPEGIHYVDPLVSYWDWKNQPTPASGYTRHWYYRINSMVEMPYNHQADVVDHTEFRELDVKVKPYKDDSNIIRHTEKQTHQVPKLPYIDELDPVYVLKTVQHIKWSLEDLGPKLDDGFSLPVFMLELFELKSLFRHAVALAAHLPTTLRKLAKNPAQVYGESYLSAVFGWIPLVQDIEEIMHRAFALRLDVEKFLNGVGKVYTHRYEKALSPETFRDSSWFDEEIVQVDNINLDALDRTSLDTLQVPGPGGSGYSYSMRRKKEVTDLEFHATTRYTYSIEEYGDGSFTELFAKLDRFGINLDVSDVWEVVPFSFLIDWIFDFSSVLERYAQEDNVPVTVVINDYCYSYKYKYRHVSKVNVASNLEVNHDLTNISNITKAEGSFRGHSSDEFSSWSTSKNTGPSYPNSSHNMFTHQRSDPVSVKNIDIDCFIRRRTSPGRILKTVYPDFRLPSGKQLVIATALLTARW